MRHQRTGQVLFWLGFLVAVAFAGLIGQGLYRNLRTLTGEELDATIWALDRPVFLIWALSITIGSVLAGVGAFIYVKTRPLFSWLAGVGVWGAVVATVMIWSRFYNATLFGVGGIVILLSFFAIVWIWMKRYTGLPSGEKATGSFRLIGYLFWINASWFLCGDTAKLHLRAFDGSPAPTPIEIMVLLVLGWFFFLLGDYQELRLTRIVAPQGDQPKQHQTGSR